MQENLNKKIKLELTQKEINDICCLYNEYAYRRNLSFEFLEMHHPAYNKFLHWSSVEAFIN